MSSEGWQFGIGQTKAQEVAAMASATAAGRTEDYTRGQAAARAHGGGPDNGRGGSPTDLRASA